MSSSLAGHIERKPDVLPRRAVRPAFLNQGNLEAVEHPSAERLERDEREVRIAIHDPTEPSAPGVATQRSEFPAEHVVSEHVGALGIVAIAALG